MAGGDYRSCDMCGGKTFYDANLNYEIGVQYGHKPYKIMGLAQYDDPMMNDEHGSQLGYLGDWAVLCEDCARTHKCIIVPIDSKETGNG